MKKVMVYVDAENVCISELSYWLNNIQESLLAGEYLQGKFYGNTCISSEIMRYCFESGFEFIETSSISATRKNITDMKLVVDCIADVVTIEDVRKVYLLSKDCDFMPLVYKLKSLNVTVEAPLTTIQNRVFTIGDLALKLEKVGYNPIAKGTFAFENQMDVIRRLLPQDFTDDLITSYLERKRKKFLHSISAMYNTNKISMLYEISIDKFCFADVIKILGIQKNQSELERLAKLYTLKFYGYCFRNEDCTNAINKYVHSL